MRCDEPAPVVLVAERGNAGTLGAVQDVFERWRTYRRSPHDAYFARVAQRSVEHFSTHPSVDVSRALPLGRHELPQLFNLSTIGNP